MDPKSNYRQRVYKLVRRIPPGRVMTYGQIAELLGEGYTPRTVGFVMHGSDDKTPWHRVINAQGACSTLGVVLPHDKQQRMLEAEGIKFNKQGRCELQTYLWIPRQRAKPEQSKTSLFKKPRRKTQKEKR
ncbi:MAG TPA: MGMT family protein [Pyrinomonadaceae bacterium]|nr:MGMT family protein [Pyrinomonadaceae bacterium]